MATAGAPINGQNITAANPVIAAEAPFAPSTNTLGAYSNPYGGYFGVQIQAALYGNGGDWSWSQDLTVTGSITSISPISGLPTIRPINFSQDDSPAPNLVIAGSTFLDWIDLPGLGNVNPQTGYANVSANLTFSFTSSVQNSLGGGCSVNWTMSLTLQNDSWNLSIQ